MATDHAGTTDAKAYKHHRLPQSIMERSEPIRLESVRRRLKENIATVEQLLKTAESPRRLSDADIKKRVASICRDLGSSGATDSQLREIVTKHSMPYHAVGALFAGGYLKRTSKGTVLGSRGRALVRAKMWR